MTDSTEPFDYTDALRQLMARVGVASFKELQRIAAVSEWQVRQLRRGNLQTMRLENLLKFCTALQVSPETFLATFGVIESSSEVETLRREYQQLQNEIDRTRDTATEEFERESLDVLESFLTYWHAAAHAVENNPQFPAKNLLPLVKPIEKLLDRWQVEPIGDIGADVSYDPQQHQLAKGTAQPGDLVRVTHLGYRHRDRLFLRVKVKSIES
ncbi:MAG: helix-turn-helix domain-containing protein [Cyanobacteria bacterium SID2]|nr:helix-turn-helix domain-containing protein [Cyanobacteria bacterium SID2]MBP0002277.1 helix-turn-helix domain-containing protein [Cyanobacteria bacterium SBC]